MPSFAPFAEFADTHSSANSANGANGCFGSIARTIKSFEKALHIFSPHPFLPPIPSALSTLSAPSIFSFGQNDIAKGPHLEAHSGRTRTSKSPFCKAIWAGRPPTARMESPLQGVEGSLREFWGLLVFPSAEGGVD